jgi:hypothetical protein
MFLGIDTGFGYTKVVSDNEKLIFKTIVEPFVKTERQTKSPIFVNGKGYLVGPDTLSDMQVSKDFFGSDEYYALIGYCLKHFQEKGVKIDGIGLSIPPGMYNEKKIAVFKYQLSRSEIIYNKDHIIVPEKIEFYSQGAGAYFDFLKNNPLYADKGVIVIDIGYYTIDFVFFNKGEGYEELFRSYPLGVEVILRKIIDEITVKYGEFISLEMAELILKTGTFRFLGKEYKIDHMEYIDNFYIPKVIKTIKEYGNIIKNYRLNLKENEDIVVVLAGGGAVYLQNRFDDVFVLNDPQFANARGIKIYMEKFFQ